MTPTPDHEQPAIPPYSSEDVAPYSALDELMLEDEPEGPQVRPWLRYWARSFDLALFCLIAGMLLGLGFPAFQVNDKVLGIVLIGAYVFVEPLLLCTWGTTPMKALLRIRLRKNDGTKPSYGEAWVRSGQVWLKGLGMGLALVSVFTMMNSYSKLNANSVTSWDKDGGFRVTHRLVGTGRTIATVAIGLGLLALFALGEAK